jgi:hypothetical protein
MRAPSRLTTNPTASSPRGAGIRTRRSQGCLTGLRQCSIARKKRPAPPDGAAGAAVNKAIGRPLSRARPKECPTRNATVVGSRLGPGVFQRARRGVQPARRADCGGSELGRDRRNRLHHQWYEPSHRAQSRHRSLVRPRKALAALRESESLLGTNLRDLRMNKGFKIMLRHHLWRGRDAPSRTGC